MLASLDDINVHLPSDKIEATDGDPEVDLAQIDAQRIIKGHLAGIFTPVTLAGWADPLTTPETIRAIAGRFIAAFIYSRAYSEDSPDVPAYAQSKYNEAMGMLNQVMLGQMILVEVPVGDTVAALSDARFLPNAKTPAPKFIMEAQF